MGVKQGAVQSCWGPRSVALGVAGGLGFWSCMHVDVGWSPTFMDTPQPRCDNTQLLQGVRRMMGVKAQQKPTAFQPQSWGARGPQSRADEGKKLQGQETPSELWPRECLGPRGPP